MEAYILILFRIFSIMLLLLFCTIFIMGKRPIGELPVFDFLSIVVMGAIVGADIADPKIKHMPTAFAVVVLAVFQRAVSTLMIKSKRVKKIITFEPTLIIRDGRFIFSNIKRIHYTIDDILMLLREKDVFDISKLDYGIIEPSGKLSVLKKPEFENITLQDMDIAAGASNITSTIILEGKLQAEKLASIGYTEQEVLDKLKQQGLQKLSDVFYAAINSQGEINVSTYSERTK